jgi:putative FmdB family regulatory protein
MQSAAPVALCLLLHVWRTLMPKYDFRCISCNVISETLLAIDESHVAPKCTLCGGDTIRVYSPPAIQFKGSGFYKTGG